ncbi:hypothetical protein ma480 [Moumouvirus australiensis]|uniref:Uncharacterized protein n=1 Tax=Moumouvirus australiensis TaxID=2109587 RepID=A0A2P1ELU7_9VIRU|nr:hypothetical protein QKC55_gp425 [Moumouvirus australiensis]AVL94866.1 hypothetical protein ma480 [Moumouvirus australiensis]
MSFNQIKYKINSKITSERYYEFILDIFDYAKKLENEMEWLSDKIYFNTSRDIGIICKSQVVGNVSIIFLEILCTRNLNLFIEILKDRDHYNVTISQIMNSINDYLNDKVISYDYYDFVQNHKIFRNLTVAELEDIMGKMIDYESNNNMIFDGI